MPPILRASATDLVLNPIVNAATEFIGSTGLAAVFLLMALESACVPVPSEAIMLFAGFAVSKGELTLVGVIAAGVLGNLVGSWVAYGVGYFGRLDLLERNRLVHVNPKHLRKADEWFERYGSATVFFSRMLPIVRTFVSLPAGVARMPFGRFTLLTVAGCIPWVTALALVGEGVGSNWETWRHNLGYLDYVVVAAAVVGVVYYLWTRRRRGPGEPGSGTEADGGSEPPAPRAPKAPATPAEAPDPSNQIAYAATAHAARTASQR
jgi:membrane protein DedA with SNARE-associated domain